MRLGNMQIEDEAAILAGADRCAARLANLGVAIPFLLLAVGVL